MQINVESTMVIIEWQDVGGVQVKFGVGVGVWLIEVGEELGGLYWLWMKIKA